MKKYTDSTLMGMSKKELIEQIRVLEQNYDVANEYLEQQAKNFSEYISKLRSREDEKGVHLQPIQSGQHGRA